MKNPFFKKISSLGLRTLSPVASGFTLIEIIIAIAMLGIVVVAFFVGLSTAYKTNKTSNNRAEAMALAQSEQEDIIKQTYDSTHDPPQYTAALVPPSGFNINISAQRVDADPSHIGDDGIQKIIITVTSPDLKTYLLEMYKVQ